MHVEMCVAHLSFATPTGGCLLPRLAGHWFHFVNVYVQSEKVVCTRHTLVLVGANKTQITTVMCEEARKHA